MGKLTTLDKKVGQPSTRDVLQQPLLGSLVAVALLILRVLGVAALLLVGLVRVLPLGLWCS